MPNLLRSALLFLSVVTALAQNPFATNTRIAVGTGPAGLAIADFNADGKKDIAVANRTGMTISVLLGNGTGGFIDAPGSPLAIEPGATAGPTSIASGDFNGDGKIDLVYIDSRPYTIGSTSGSGPVFNLRVGNGDGTFAPSVGAVGVGFSLDRIKAIDMNGDGKLDIAGDYRFDLSSAFGALAGRIYSGDGTGRFTFASGGSTEANDLNGDGKLDYVNTTYAPRNFLPSLVVNTATASGYSSRTFSGPLVTGTPTTSQLRISDFDRDGALDVIVLHGTLIQAWRGDGAGGFVLDFRHPVGSSGSSLALADFDGDGVPDWAVRSGSAVEVGFLRQPLLTAGPVRQSHPLGAGPGDIEVADFNNDGKPDLVAVNSSGNDLSLLLSGSVSGTTQTINFPSISAVLANSIPFAINPTASSGLVVAVASSSPSVCTVSGNIVTIIGKGSCVLTATQPGNSTYQAAPPVSRTIPVNGVPQTVTVGPVASRPLGSPPFTPQVTTSSGLPFHIRTNGASSVCAVNNNVVTLLTPGRCDLIASQSGDNVYEPAFNLFNFEVTGDIRQLLPQTLTFEPIGEKIVSTTPFRVEVIASSGLPTTLQPSSPTTTLTCTATQVSPNSWDVTAIAPGTCNLVGSQNGGGTHVPVTITRIVPIVLANRQPLNLSIEPKGNVSLASNSTSITVTGSNTAPLVLASETPSTCSTFPLTGVRLLAIGVCTVTVTSPGNDYYLPGGPVSVSFTIVDGPTQLQTITFPSIPNYPVGTAPFVVSATSSSSYTVTLTSTTSSVCTVSSFTVTILQQGTCSITASQPGNAVYLPASPVTRSFSVTAPNASLAQSITFNLSGNARLGNGPFTVAATASSGLPVAFTSETPAICTVTGLTIIPVAIGQCTITATQAGNGTYQAAVPITRSVNIIPNLFDQSIAPNGLPHEVTVSAGSVTVTYAATSGLPVTVTTTSLGYCSVSGYTVYLLAPGICSLTATVSGDVVWAPLSRTNTLPIRDPIVLQPQTLTFAPLPDRVLGTGPFLLNASTSSQLPASFLTTTSDTCSVTSGGTLTLKKVGTCSVTAFQNGRSVTNSGETLFAAAPPITRTFNIAAGGNPTAQPQTITFAPLSDRTLSQGPAPVTATASSGLPVTFTSETASVCTVSSNLVTLLSTGSCVITASQGGNSNWAPAASVTRSFAVASPTQAQTLTFNPPASVARSANTILLSATITPGPGSITFTSSTTEICSPSGVSLSLFRSGTCSVTATASPTTLGAFQPISITRLITITGSAQTISFPVIADRPLSSGSFSINATASSNLGVTLIAAGACTISNNTVSLLGVGTCTITARQPGDVTWDPAPEVVRSFQITGSALQSQTIDFAQPADRFLSDGAFTASAVATSGLPVTLTSTTPTTCSVQGLSVQPLAIGVCTIIAAQPGNSSYNPATAVTRSFAVIPGLSATPSITSVVNAASYVSGAVAPNSYVAIFGRSFGTSPRVSIRDAAGTVYALTPVYSADTQINLVWPDSVLGAATVTVESGGTSGTFSVAVINTVPALFSANGSGQGLAAANALIVAPDGSVTTRVVNVGPIPVLGATEIYLVLYGTGIRGAAPNGVTAKIAGRSVEVLYAGAQGTFPGLDQINLRIPLSFGGLGAVDVELTVDGVQANRVTVEF